MQIITFTWINDCSAGVDDSSASAGQYLSASFSDIDFKAAISPGRSP